MALTSNSNHSQPANTVRAVNSSEGPFPPVGQMIQTDLNMYDQISQILRQEEDQDGAEGLPLVFDLTALNHALASPSHLASTSAFAEVAQSTAVQPPNTTDLSQSPIPPQTGASIPQTTTNPPHTALDHSPRVPRRHNPVVQGGIQKPPQKEPTATKKLRLKLKNLTKRRARAAEAATSRIPNFFRTPRLKAAQHLPPPEIIKTELDRKTLPVATHAWVGQHLKPSRSTPWTILELLDKGFRVVEWDGKSTKIVTDKDGHGIAFFVGAPMGAQGGEWDQVARRVAETMESVREEGLVSGALPGGHRRGDFVALAVGVSHGGGQKRPGTLAQPPKRQKLIQRLLSDKNIQRFAGYQSSSLSYYSPGHYAHYCHHLLRVYEHDESLQRNFAESIFPATSFNLGPATVSLEHTDYGNVGYGFCALAAFGSFDHRTGGHLILFDLGLIVQFPPGSIALLLSGILRHGNTPIQPHERRYSMAQYCAGGLLRWFHYGFRTSTMITKGKTPKQAKTLIAQANGDHEERVREALSLFTRVDKLDEVRRSTYENFHKFLMNPLPDT